MQSIISRCSLFLVLLTLQARLADAEQYYGPMPPHYTRAYVRQQIKSVAARYGGRTDQQDQAVAISHKLQELGVGIAEQWDEKRQRLENATMKFPKGIRLGPIHVRVMLRPQHSVVHAVHRDAMKDLLGALDEIYVEARFQSAPRLSYDATAWMAQIVTVADQHHIRLNPFQWRNLKKNLRDRLHRELKSVLGTIEMTWSDRVEMLHLFLQDVAPLNTALSPKQNKDVYRNLAYFTVRQHIDDRYVGIRGKPDPENLADQDWVDILAELENRGQLKPPALEYVLEQLIWRSPHVVLPDDLYERVQQVAKTPYRYSNRVSPLDTFVRAGAPPWTHESINMNGSEFGFGAGVHPPGTDPTMSRAGNKASGQNPPHAKAPHDAPPKPQQPPPGSAEAYWKKMAEQPPKIEPYPIPTNYEEALRGRTKTYKGQARRRSIMQIIAI